MARPKTFHEQRVTTAIRLPESLHRRLSDEADARDVSLNLLVTKAVENYLEALLPLEELISTR